MHLKVSSAKWRPFCFGLNVLTNTSRGRRQADDTCPTQRCSSIARTGSARSRMLYWPTSSGSHRAARQHNRRVDINNMINPLHRNGEVVRFTALVVIGDIEACSPVTARTVILTTFLFECKQLPNKINRENVMLSPNDNLWATLHQYTYQDKITIYTRIYTNQPMFFIRSCTGVYSTRGFFFANPNSIQIFSCSNLNFDKVIVATFRLYDLVTCAKI